MMTDEGGDDVDDDDDDDNDDDVDDVDERQERADRQHSPHSVVHALTWPSALSVTDQVTSDPPIQ